MKIGKISFSVLTGVLALGLYGAEWIRPVRTARNRSFELSKTFVCTGDVVKATLNASAAGIGVWRINGSRVGEDYYEPVVSYYKKRIFSRTYDVTGLLAATNTLAVEVGGGWWEQNLAWACERKTSILGCGYGSPAAWGQLTIEFAGGGRTMISTGADWVARDGRSVWNNIYGGEIFDARDAVRAEMPVCTAKDVTGTIEECPISPCRVLKRLRGRISSLLGNSGDFWVYDFRTNIAGAVAFNLPALVPGSRLKVRLAETLTTEGFLDQRSGGSWATHHATEYVYIAPEKPAPTRWVPEFSYTSFRYAEISGYEPFPDQNWGAKPPDDLIEAVMIANDIPRTGFVRCAHEPTQRLVDIVDHTILCNLHGVPEDCPGREKSGWLGDAQLVAPYALMNFDLNSFYSKFMGDISDAFEISGKIPFLVPTERAMCWGEASPLWRAAAVVIPYELYMRCADEVQVRKNWALIKHVMSSLKQNSSNGVIRTGLGDWIPPGGNPRKMPVPHSSTLCWIDCADKVAKMSQSLGLDAGEDCSLLAATLRKRFIEEFYDRKSHTYGHNGTDAAAWCLGVHPEGERDMLLEAMLERLRKDSFRMVTGIYASWYFAKALLRSGHEEELLKCFFNPKLPSYRTVLEEGQTTLPEELGDKLKVPRKGQGQRSLSHPMHAGYLRVLAEEVAGIRPLEPGYKCFEVMPCKSAAYREISVEVPAPSGRIRFNRDKEGRVALEVPQGTRCLYRPTGSVLQPGKYSF